MVTNWRPRYPLWQAVVNYFNECYSNGRTPTRKNMLRRLREQGFSGSVNSIDSYRNYLHQAGYIGTIRRGTYSIDDLIPSDLSVDDCRSHAYSGLHPIPEVPRIQRPVRVARRTPREPMIRIMGVNDHPEPVNVVDEFGDIDVPHIEQEFPSASSSAASSSATSTDPLGQRRARRRDPRTGIEFITQEEMEL